jgi:hypothetical protein
MAGGRPPARNLNKRPFWGSLFLRRRETIPVCHALLQDIKFFKLLLHIDHELAAQTRAVGCPCGGILHQANYPRKPRGCPNELRSVYASRFSFSCNRCRKRATSQSVRFLGRRVYLALAVVLVSARLAGPRGGGGWCGPGLRGRHQRRRDSPRRWACPCAPCSAGATGGAINSRSAHSGKRLAPVSCRRWRSARCPPVCSNALAGRRANP